MDFIEFDIFKVLLLSAKNMDDLMAGLESALNVQFGDGLIMDAQGELLNLLVDKCEHDADEQSVIYTYAFDDKWGTESRIYYLNGKAYYVRDIETLYKYLQDKFEYDIAKDDCVQNI